MLCEIVLRVNESLCSKKTIALIAFGVIVSLIIPSFKFPVFGILSVPDSYLEEHVDSIENINSPVLPTPTTTTTEAPVTDWNSL